MNYHRQHLLYLSLILLCICISCNNEKAPSEKKIESVPVTPSAGVDVYIKNLLAQSQASNGNPGDSLELPFYKVLVNFYDSVNFVPVWSNHEKWNPLSDSLISYLDTASRDGLFRDDYNAGRINELKSILS